MSDATPSAVPPAAAPPSVRCEAPGVPRAARALAWGNGILLAALALAFTWYLWPQWLRNPDLSHGLLMPVVFLLLLGVGRRTGPPRFPRAGIGTVAATALPAIAALVGLGAAGLFAISLGWSHSVVQFTLAAAFAAALLAALAAFSADPVRVVPVNWAILAAIGLWLLAAPMPPGTYSRLTLELQGWVTGRVLGALHLLGIAARQQGNVIELAGATVGVEEACSGIRSLLACLFAALFLSGFLVRRPAGRVVLLVLAAPLAIAMNVVRSLALTLLANAGVEIRGGWHDVTGYAVLVVTAALLTGLALALEPARARAPGGRTSPPVGRPGSRSAALAGQAVLGAFLAAACLIAGFFIVRTRPAVHAGRPAPDLAAVLPAAAEGWTVATTTDLFRFADALETNALCQRTYYRGSGGDETQVTIYLAYWPPGQTSVSNVALHTPDACWPGAGWQSRRQAATQFAGSVGGRALPPAEYRLFLYGDVVQHVWFWHLYNGTPIAQSDPRSVRELLGIAWRYGFRREGEQLFVRVSSNRPWDAIAGEPLLADVFARLRPLGL